MIRLKENDVHWQVAPDFQPHLHALLADAGRVVKDTPDRLVTAHEIGDRTVYVKRYRKLRPLKRSEAAREWAMAARLAERGLPVVRYLAFGRNGRSEIVVSEGFDGVRLDKYPHAESHELQTALGRLVRLMHDRGVLQDDLHHNLLVREQPIQLCRIDPDRGTLKSKLTDRDRLSNLAAIALVVPLSDTFFSAYGAQPSFVRTVREASVVLRRRLAAHRAKRCLQRNAKFAREKFGGHWWWVRRDYLATGLSRLLSQPELGTLGEFVVREFPRTLLGRRQARRAYRDGYHRELLGEPGPRPAALAGRRVVFRQ